MKEKTVIKRTTVRKTYKWDSENVEKTSIENGLSDEKEGKNTPPPTEVNKRYDNWFDK